MAYLNPTAGAVREDGTLQVVGAPVAGTNEVQTLTFGGTPTGGTFKLTFDAFTTSAISWSATNATLVSNIDTALGALTSVGGVANVTTAVGTMTAGIGTITVTFTGTLAKKDVGTISVFSNSLTGTSPTLGVTVTTPGVDATHRTAPQGALMTDDEGTLYINTGATEGATAWVVVGTQT